VHHQEIFTVHTAMYTGLLTACCQQTCMTYTSAVCTVKKKTPDDGQRNCPKNVEFYSKNKFEKLVRIFAFIIRIYHDVRSPERQIYHRITNQFSR